MVWNSAPKQLLVVLLCQGKRQTWYNSTLASRRKRLTAHFEDLEQCYFSNKMAHITGSYEPDSHILWCCQSSLDWVWVCVCPETVGILRLFCVCCVQRKAETWTSWMISWSVWPSSPATTRYALWPPSPTPATSTTAPVSFLGKTLDPWVHPGLFSAA